jgi:hypothetical protein
MEKSFSQLKRDLQKGRQLIMTYNSIKSRSENLNIPRFIIKTQTNGIYLSKDKDATKGSFLELPRAALMEYIDDIIRIYEPAIRELTKDEQFILDNCPSKRPENAERLKLEIMTDGSGLYWKDKAYYKENGGDWYYGENCGLRFMMSENKMRDAGIKGILSLEYKLI